MYNNTQLQGFTNNILNMDCLDFMRECPDKYFDLCCCDPPYGIGASSATYMRSNRNRTSKNQLTLSGQNYKSSCWDNKIPSEEIFNQIFRISKNQIIWGGNYFVEYLQNSQCWLVWDKVTGDNDYADCELAYTSLPQAVRKFTYMWKGMFQQDMKNKEIRQHPTQKPVKLFEWCIKQSDKYLKEDSIILDCFSGSGTTAIACHNLNRNFICIEKDVDYYNASVERLNNAKAQLKLF